MNDLWWAPREIYFTREQVIWLFEHLPAIREGNWPPRPTSYTEPNVQKSPSSHAPFETPVQIAAELLVRLENAGQDGAMCKMEYVYGEPAESIAKHWHLPGWVIQRRISRALNYCCGWRRKKMRYPAWRKQNDYRRGSQISS